MLAKDELGKGKDNWAEGRPAESFEHKTKQFFFKKKKNLKTEKVFKMTFQSNMKEFS